MVKDNPKKTHFVRFVSVIFTMRVVVWNLWKEELLTPVTLTPALRVYVSSIDLPVGFLSSGHGNSVENKYLPIRISFQLIRCVLRLSSLFLFPTGVQLNRIGIAEG